MELEIDIHQELPCIVRGDNLMMNTKEFNKK
jgi:hypothetical protein